jgi:hypothetical protein
MFIIIIIITTIIVIFIMLWKFFESCGWEEKDLFGRAQFF